MFELLPEIQMGLEKQKLVVMQGKNNNNGTDERQKQMDEKEWPKLEM